MCKEEEIKVNAWTEARFIEEVKKQFGESEIQKFEINGFNAYDGQLGFKYGDKFGVFDSSSREFLY